MLHRLRHRLGYLILARPGLTSAGESRAHGPLSEAAYQAVANADHAL